MSTSRVQCTYGSHNRKAQRPSLALPSSPTSALSSSPTPTPLATRPRKRGLSKMLTGEAGNAAPLFPSSKRKKNAIKPVAPSSTLKSKPKSLPKASTKADQKTLTQLHFNIDQSILRRCSLCDLSYTKGAPDDEALHKTHCTRVRQDMEWGREEEKDRMRGTENVVVEVRAGIKLAGNKKKGRIICLPADVGGKLGTKLSALYKIVNISLSSPQLSATVLQSSKAYLFLLPHETQTHRECIVGCIIAQRISSAMAVIAASTSTHAKSSDTPTSDFAPPNAVLIDTATGLFCSPDPLPTSMGIPRLFVAPSHRRLGIARALLDAAAATFIHGCPLDPESGRIAFSQPTGMGQKVMKSWGKGGIRVYEED